MIDLHKNLANFLYVLRVACCMAVFVVRNCSTCHGIYAVRKHLSTLDIWELSPLSCLFLLIAPGLKWHITGTLMGFLRWWYTLVYCKIYIVIGSWKWRKPLCHKVCISHAILRSMKGNLRLKYDRLKKFEFSQLIFQMPNVYSRRKHGTCCYGV